MEEAFFEWLQVYYKLTAPNNLYELLSQIFYGYNQQYFDEPKELDSEWALQYNYVSKLRDNMIKFCHEQLKINDEIYIPLSSQVKKEEDIIKLFSTALTIIVNYVNKDELIYKLQDISENNKQKLVKLFELEDQNHQQPIRNKTELLEKIDDLELENQNLLFKNQELLKDIGNLNQQTNNQKIEIQQKDNEIETLKKTLENKAKELDFESIQNQAIEDLKFHNLRLQDDLNKLQTEKNDIQKELEKFEEIIQDKEELFKKATQVPKLENKIDQLKEKVEQQKQLFKKENEDNQEQIEKLKKNISKTYQQYSDVKEESIQYQFENEKIKQEFERLKQENCQMDTKYQQVILELNQKIDKLQESQCETQRSSLCQQSPRYLDQDFFQGMKQHEFKLQEQIEQVALAKYEQKLYQECQLLKERIKTLEVQISTKQQENQKLCQNLGDVQDRLKVYTEKENDDQIETYVQCLVKTKNQEIMLLNSLIFELMEKYQDIKLNYNSLVKDQARSIPLKPRNRK